MGFHVCFEVVGLGEGFETYFASMAFDLIVQLHVFREFVVVYKHLVANCTNVGLEVGVTNAHVLDQFRRVVELGLTDLTVQRMGSHVGCQIILLVKSLLTYRTSERPFISMRSNVRFKIV